MSGSAQEELPGEHHRYPNFVSVLRARRGDTAKINILESASKFALQTPTFNTAARDVNIHIQQPQPDYPWPPQTQQKASSSDLASWLSPLNWWLYHQEAVRQRTVNIGAWFLEGPEFQRWLEGRYQLLWGTGPPGSGKTILSSSVVDYLRKTLKDGNAAFAFAYLRWWDQNTTVDVVRGLIKQLLQSHEAAIYPTVLQAYDLHEKRQTALSLDDAVELLSEVICNFETCYIVLDGLDETPGRTTPDLLKVVVTLPAQILIFSRPLPLLGYLAPAATPISVGARVQDIQYLVSKRIEDSPTLARLLQDKPSLVHQIHATLQERSRGLLLVAALQIEALTDDATSRNVRTLLGALSTLPSTINDIYLRTLQRIEERPEAELAKYVLLWLANARRPLSIVELQHALAITMEENFDPEDIVSEEVLVSSCCGLVANDRVTGQVRFIHYTAQEYFQSLARAPFSYSPTIITRACVSYLRRVHLLRSNIKLRLEADRFLGLYPFLSYAYHNWASHPFATRLFWPECVFHFVLEECFYCPYPLAEDFECGSSSGEIFDLIGPIHLVARFGLLSLVPYILNSVPYDCPTPNLGFTALHFAAYHGHATIVSILLNTISRGQINAQTNDGNTALHLAAWSGHESIFRTLVFHEDVDIDLPNLDGDTAFSFACQRGTDVMVDLLASQDDGRQTSAELIRASWNPDLYPDDMVERLLEYRNVDVNLKDEEGLTALMRASSIGDIAIVRRLTRHRNIDPNRRDPQGRTALSFAVFHSKEAGVDCVHDVIELLLSLPKTDPNLPTEGGNTPLISAVKYRAHHTVTLLLKNEKVREGINMRNAKGNSALLEASRKCCSASVRKLLAVPSIDINIRNKHGYNSLLLAVRSIKPPFADGLGVIEILLTHNADPTPNPQTGEDAFIAVCSVTKQSTAEVAGRRHIIEALLSSGKFTVNHRGASGMTPLMVAAREGGEEVVDALLCQPGLHSGMAMSDGTNALILACGKGYAGIVAKLLLTDKIDINASRMDGNTALIIASWAGHRDVVELLLQRPGIQVNCRNKRNTTALMDACRGRHYSIVDLLLQHPEVDVNTVNQEGDTALLLAAKWGDTPPKKHLTCPNGVVQLVSHPRLNINHVRWSDGFTALHEVCQAGHMALFLLLLSHPDLDTTICDAHGKSPRDYTVWADDGNMLKLLDLNVRARRMCPEYPNHCQVHSTLHSPSPFQIEQAGVQMWQLALTLKDPRLGDDTAATQDILDLTFKNHLGRTLDANSLASLD